mgnify:CR=1 FL=1
MKKLFFCIFMLTSCSFKKDIMVSYLYDGVETPFSVEPKKFDSDFQHYKVDMSYIPKNEFDSIYNGFKKTNDKKIEEFDVRFSVKIGNAKYYINRWFDVVNVHHDNGCTTCHIWWQRTFYLPESIIYQRNFQGKF